MPPSPQRPLLSVRAAVVLLLSTLVAACATALSFMANHSLPEAGLVGGGALGGAVLFFHTIIGR